MSLLWPGFLYLFLLIPLAILVYLWVLRRRRRFAVFESLPGARSRSETILAEEAFAVHPVPAGTCQPGIRAGQTGRDRARPI